MKKFKRFSALVAILSLLLVIAPIPATAGPAVYNIAVSVSSANTVVTPTAANGKPKSITVTNDGATTIYLDFDRVAVAASLTAIKIKPCEGVTVNLDQYPSPFAVTTLGLITSSGTSTAQVTAHYMTGTSPQVTPTAERIVRFSNPGCTTDTGLTTTNGASWLPYADSEQITLSTVGLTTDSTANLLHANSVIDAVVCRQTTAITTSTNWGISDPTTANRFAAATTIATTTLVGLDQHDPQGAAAANGPKQLVAAKLRITVTVSNPGAGVVRCSVFGRTAVVPAS